MQDLKKRKGHTQCTKLPLLWDRGEMIDWQPNPHFRRG